MAVLKLTCLAALTVLSAANISAADEYRWYNGRWYLIRAPRNAVVVESANPFAAATGTGTATSQRDGGGGSSAAAAAASGTIDLERLESRIATLQIARSIQEIRERLGMKPASDGASPVSLAALIQSGGAGNSLLLEILAQRLAGMGTATGCASTTTLSTPAASPVGDPELQASQTMLELLQAWRSEQEQQKKLNEGFQARLKELEELQARLATERKARLDELTQKINELKPRP